jgi:hypothetical protein
MVLMLRKSAAKDGVAVTKSTGGDAAMKHQLAPRMRLVLMAGFLWTTMATGASAVNGKIGGDTRGGVSSAGPENPDPENRDDEDLTVSTDITFITTSTMIDTALKNNNFPELNHYVYAGQGPIGSHFTPIDASDFDVRIYQQWVVNSPDISSPSGKETSNREVKDQDAGGVNILVTYTPTAAADPRTMNFLQGISTTANDGTPDIGIDGDTGSPYYNHSGVTGVGNDDENMTPMDIPVAPKSFAYLIDSPYTCESGSNGTGKGCPPQTPANDETITKLVRTFDTFVEADEQVDGKTYQVLFGGIEWGYTFTATDGGVPELSTWSLLLMGFAVIAALARRSAGRKAAS